MHYTLLQQTAPSGAEALSLLFKPAADIAYIGITPFALARRLGMPIKIVAIAQKLGTGHGIVGVESLCSRSNRQFVLGTVAGSTGHQIASDWANQENVNVRFLYLTPNQQLLAFRQGYLDGMASWEPFLSRALAAGGRKVCDAQCLQNPIFNIVCATDGALITKGPLIEKFLIAHINASKGIVTGESLDDLGGLSSVFSSEISPDAYRTILQQCYVWPSSPCSESDRSELEAAFSSSWGFLERVGFSMDKSSDNKIFGEPSSIDLGAEQLTVAHTDSLMCAGYHLAVTHRDFEKLGFRVVVEPQLRGQRLAMLNKQSRAEVLTLDALVETEPKLAILGCRQKSERLLKSVYDSYFGGVVAKESADKVIESLKNSGFFQQPTVYSAAHWIRNIGNWVNHNLDSDTDIHEDLVGKARECVGSLLTILEWHHTEASRLLAEYRACRNQRCKEKMRRTDKCCPNCGTDQSGRCPQCDSIVLQTWRNCAACGLLLVKARTEKANGS